MSGRGGQSDVPKKVFLKENQKEYQHPFGPCEEHAMSLNLDAHTKGGLELKQIGYASRMD